MTANSGTRNTIKTDTGKIINRKFFRDHCFRLKEAINTTGEINSKNRHCLRGLNGQHGRWDEIVQNPKQTESDPEDDDDDDEGMPEETEIPTKVHDTSEAVGSYVPVRTSPEDDALQIYTDGGMTGEN